jgi:hypothetical protein
MAQDPDTLETAVIRSEIERTRVELGHTIDAIQDRLSPRRVMHDAKENIRDATIGRAQKLAERISHAVNSGNGSSRASAMWDTARNNPTATVLTGAVASALIAAVLARSRRPALARGFGGLALTVALAALAQQTQRRLPPPDSFPGSAM